MNILRGYADKFEQESIDEASLDITDRVELNFNRAKELAIVIKREILEKEKLTCSIGVAPNKLVAKIASGFSKPDGLTVVLPEEVSSFLSPLPIGKLYGVGDKTEKKMFENNIKTIGDLAQQSVEVLMKIFGAKLGVYFSNASKGIDVSPAEERKTAQISRITTLRENTRNIEEIINDLNGLCGGVHQSAVDKTFTFRSIGIIIVTENMRGYSRRKTLNTYTNNLETMKEVCIELLKKFLETSQLRIRRIGVNITDLKTASTQKSLMDYR
ncbi:MAG: DNA polymerase IV [Candidatus Bathyarchaeota archaeon]